MAQHKHCLQCGADLPAYSGKGQRAKHCSTACRKAFNNLRATRGALLYDLFMASRFERGAADQAGLRSVMSRLASEWRDDDKAAGVDRSWGDWEEWLATHPAFNPSAVRHYGSA